MKDLQSMAEPTVLIVEDVLSLAETYAAFLKGVGFVCTIIGTGEEALQLLSEAPFDAVVLDVNLPDISGPDVMRAMRAKGIPAEVIVITADGSINLAVEVMRNGATDFLVKPFNAERLRVTVKNAIERKKLSATISAFKEDLNQNGFGNFIGNSLPMQAVYRILKSAAPSSATVFVTGESGTGKELCAEALHMLSKRAKGPLITLNCAAIPKDLLESEIFGHAKGAFTGATSERNGAALQADGGTLFLDEICEMDLSLQSKLLRFLQTKQVQRLGEDRLRSSDVRIVCATNRNPQVEVQAGRFREDLFYRLHVIPVDMPPLNMRGDDIIQIATKFLRAFAKEDQKGFIDFAPEAATALLNYSWPGNVRQLQNVIRNIIVLNEGVKVSEDMLPTELLIDRHASASHDGVDTSPLRFIMQKAVVAPARAAGIKPLEDVIRETVEAAVENCDGSIPRAAAALDVSPSTLYRRIESWRTESAA
jgi:two-component system, repressor protein LuxO